MNQSVDAQWSQQEQYDGLTAMPEDDFSNFLDLDNIDLNFPIYDPSGLDAQNNQQIHNQNGNITQQQMLDLQQYGNMQGMSGQMEDVQQDVLRGHTAALDFAMQHSFQQQQNQFYNGQQGQMYQQPFQVPATPNSVEMHPNYNAHGRDFGSGQIPYSIQQHFHLRKDDAMAALTPLVSPQIPGSVYSSHHHTPNLPEFTMPGAYLSPLSSPALGPQQNNGQFPTHMQRRTAPSSLSASPIVPAMDHNYESPQSSEERPRKSRKRTPTMKAATGARLSQTQTAGTKRRRSFNFIAPTVTITENGNSPNSSSSPSQHSQGGPSPATTKSASPQPSDGTMLPPPKPTPLQMASLMPSTLNIDQSTGLPPATPASLMRLRQQQQEPVSPNFSPAVDGSNLTSPVTRALGQSLEDLRLPDSAKPQPAAGIRAPIRITTGLKPVASNTPASTPTSTTQSKTPLFSSTLPSPAASMASGKVEPRGSRGSRKRATGSTSLVSPALRPKISPSIKPLLPEGSSSLTTDTHTLLLASKSNYQNILEGTTLPGVNYPPELSSNLTSKRTSHKIAEQGRRNRINTALQEMQSLLPSPSTFMANGTSIKDGDEDGSPDEGDVAAAGLATPAVNGKDGLTSPPNGPNTNINNAGSKTPSMTAISAATAAAAAAAAGGNSKAATVELAIEYIKHLNAKLAEKEKENERLRLEVLGMKTTSGGGGEEGADGVVGGGSGGGEDVAMLDGIEIAGANTAMAIKTEQSPTNVVSAEAGDGIPSGGVKITTQNTGADILITG